MTSRVGMAVAAAAAAAVLLARPAAGEYHGQFGAVSPEIHEWAEGLKSGAAPGGCCATTDGWRPEEVEWDTNSRHYRVRIEGRWYEVPDNAVLTSPNRLGFPVVWYGKMYPRPGQGEIYIRCFLPGAGG